MVKTGKYQKSTFAKNVIAERKARGMSGLAFAEVACEPNAFVRGMAGFGNAQHNTIAQLNFKTQSCIANHIETQKANAGLKLMEQALPEQTKK